MEIVQKIGIYTLLAMGFAVVAPAQITNAITSYECYGPEIDNCQGELISSGGNIYLGIYGKCTDGYVPIGVVDPTWTCSFVWDTEVEGYAENDYVDEDDTLYLIGEEIGRASCRERV